MCILTISPQSLLLLAAFLSIAAFAIYIAWLVVPQVLRAVVPIVVEQVTGS